MKENSIKEDIEILEKNIKSVKENADMAFFESDEDYCFFKAVEHILSDYKRVLEMNESWKSYSEELEEKNTEISNKKCELEFEVEKLQKENEELNKNYNSLIDKIILKIDEYDYKFEKAKRQNDKDKSDYYWDLIKEITRIIRK